LWLLLQGCGFKNAAEKTKAWYVSMCPGHIYAPPVALQRFGLTEDTLESAEYSEDETISALIEEAGYLESLIADGGDLRESGEVGGLAICGTEGAERSPLPDGEDDVRSLGQTAEAPSGAGAAGFSE
jgi:hypothetical protein